MSIETKKLNLRENLMHHSKEELADFAIKLINDKKEVENDLKTVGTTLIKILQMVGFMNKNLEFTMSVPAVVSALTGLGSDFAFRPKIIQEKFSFTEKTIPLLNKYAHLLK
jgi:hypothetical protein